MDKSELIKRPLHSSAQLFGPVDELAHRVAAYHKVLPAIMGNTPCGTPATVLKPLLNNFRHIQKLLPDPADQSRLRTIKSWIRARYSLLSKLISTRRAQGFVRECADLWLDNNIPIVISATKINSNQGMDTMNSVARLMMELNNGAAAHFLDFYLEDSGDYAGLALLRIYQIQQAVIVALEKARLIPTHLTAEQQTIAHTQCRTYLDMALDALRPAPRLLIIAHGPSGSGKTTITNHLLDRLGAVRIRSDVERKRLFGLAPLARSGSTQFSGIYTANANRRTYQRIEELAGVVLAAGFPVIVEATFLKRIGRDAMRALAKREGAIFILLDLHAAPDTLRARVTERQRLGMDASEAGVAVLEHQLATAEPLDADEMDAVVIVDTESNLDMDALADRLARRNRSVA